MNNIIEIEKDMTITFFNLGNYINKEGYSIKEVFLTGLLYLITHDNEFLIDLVNKEFYIVKNQRLQTIAIKLNTKDAEEINDLIGCSQSLYSIRRAIDILNKPYYKF